MHVDLATTSLSLAGLSANRTYTCTATDSTTAVSLFAADAASAAASTGVPLREDSLRKPILILKAGESKRVTDGSTYVGYSVLRGAPTAVWVDADAAITASTQPAGNVRWDKPAVDGAAGTATAEHEVYRAPAPRTVAAVYFVPDAALTANDTNYATITVSVRDAAGTTVGTCASQTTKIAGGSGNWTAFLPVALTLGAALSLTAGQTLTVAITKTAAGVVVQPGTLHVDFAA